MFNSEINYIFYVFRGHYYIYFSFNIFVHSIESFIIKILVVYAERYAIHLWSSLNNPFPRPN